MEEVIKKSLHRIEFAVNGDVETSVVEQLEDLGCILSNRMVEINNSLDGLATQMDRIASALEGLERSGIITHT